VLPFKRFWSAQITQHQIFAIIQQYQPQQLLLRRPFSPEMKALVDDNYTLVYEEELYQLFIANFLVKNVQ